MASQYRQTAFTLVEMVVTISIVAILVGIAVPSFRSLMNNNRAISTSNALVQILTSARSEAVRQQKMVAVCKTADGSSCTASGDWDQGILTISFDDTNGDQKFTVGEPVTVLRSDFPFSKVTSVRSVDGLGVALAYNPSGHISISTSAHFLVSPRGADSAQTRLVYLYFGRPQVRKAV